jgi:2-hydroxy-3-keto-5-methylthiopentenyl-1-phosphate phosphatase
MDWVLLSDFDGTIVDADTALYLLTEFAEGDWRKVISKYVKGDISLQECMSIQYPMLKTSRSLMLKTLEENIGFRSNF